MNVPLRLLHVEDNPAHVEMVRLLLETEGFKPHVTRVETASQLEQQLEAGDYDLIVSDCTMPAFHGLAALELARQRRPDIPFVFYSGTIGEEAAVESLKRGAMDFVPKGRPEKLAPAVRHALQEGERHRERSLREQRVQAMGALTAGIAHTVNNVLNSVLIAAEQLRERVHESDNLRTLDVIRASAKRGSEMITDVLAFTRGTGHQVARVDLKALIGEAAALLREVFPRTLRIETRIADDLQPIPGNATQLYQVLLNLCVNARDAMPGGGRLIIEATNVPAERRRMRSRSGRVPAPQVLLSVKDTGSGIPAEILPKIFEPFFSTKAVGKGVGLGLSTVSEIVTRHGGCVEVSSQVGQGSNFEVFLPAIT